MKTLIAIACLLAVVACSASPVEQPDTLRVLQRSGYMANTSGEVPEGLYCPESDSRAAEGVPSEVDVTESQSGKIVAIGGGARVHIRLGVVFTGDIIICGGGATLIAEGNFSGRVLVEGGGARVVLVDRDPNVFESSGSAVAIYLKGGGPELIACNERANYSGLPNCRDVF